MLYSLLNQLIDLVKKYETEAEKPSENILEFNNWLNAELKDNVIDSFLEPEWLGKANGRSEDSVINTSLVHLYRYAKMHAKNAIADTSFSTPDEFIYLIGLASGGSMGKTALIKQNIHEKPVGTLIINRLLKKGMIEERLADGDKRSRIISITNLGTQHLKESMDKIKIASANVTEPLSQTEKMNLINLLLKLENFHWSQSEKKIG
ncbi:MarR family winged helix-turn-helix transcriptional regulator [Pedobacter jejuensis]|uniref:MarR family transcriptional regulator n=1 Tax=Pedobacter jejuensis TaxID=1268550 RepID=A0A3N0BSU9_9SPHI|nr:MarR family winged helix-turn-helix transcriptional regulator [Pedobacter jejuensis]RNL52126.1 MarR family transcriptional regulator [Pedobacter jejuensis]